MSVRVSLQNYFLSSLFYLGFSYSIHSHCGVLFVSHETGNFLRPAFLLAPRCHTAHKATANASTFFMDPRSRYIGLFDGVSAITSEPMKIRRQVKLDKKSFREIFRMSLTKWYVCNWNVWKNCAASVARELSQNSCRHGNIYRLLRSLRVLSNSSGELSSSVYMVFVFLPILGKFWSSSRKILTPTF